MYFSQFWSLGSPRSRCRQIQSLVRTIFLVHRWWIFLLYCHVVQMGRELSGASFMRTLIPFLKACPHDLITSLRSHLHIPSLWGLEFNTNFFFFFFLWGCKYSVHGRQYQELGTKRQKRMLEVWVSGKISKRAHTKLGIDNVSLYKFS